MKLAVTFELPLGSDQVDREGDLSDHTFAQVEPVFDQVERRLAKALAGDETRAWAIGGNHRQSGRYRIPTGAVTLGIGRGRTWPTGTRSGRLRPALMGLLERG